jgi:serine/threonine protein kinase
LQKLNNFLFFIQWRYHYNCQKKSFSKFIQIFGFTQDPNSLNYIIVMSYAKKGSLRKCLYDINKFKWQDKLKLLKKIILGLKVIHESNLTHGDFHDGNILLSDNYEAYIIDLGLCKPISDLQNSDIYGVLPYMAPEILRKKPYTPASDIYSFSIIMWEFTSGIPPFKYKAHDCHLGTSVSFSNNFENCLESFFFLTFSFNFLGKSRIPKQINQSIKLNNSFTDKEAVSSVDSGRSISIIYFFQIRIGLFTCRLQRQIISENSSINS